MIRNCHLMVMPLGISTITDIIHGRRHILNLPSDAVVLRARDSIEYNGIELLLSSDKFKRVEEGNLIPYIIAECEIQPKEQTDDSP